jgi:hypothetical protein
MVSATCKAFSFLYVHRGQTNLWELTKSEFDTGPREGEQLGAKLAGHDDKREWYRVVIEPGPDEDMGDAIDRAEASSGP